MNKHVNYNCLVPGCEEPHHARGLCDAHFQEWRRTGIVPMPENRARSEREGWIHCELCTGNVPQRASASGSMFDSDEERRAAWDERKDELMEEEYTGDSLPYMGHRPWAWWRYESGCPELRSSPPEVFDFTLDMAERTRYEHEHEVKKFIYLAQRGFLTDAEIERVAAKGEEARERIGTDHEHRAAE